MDLNPYKCSCSCACSTHIQTHAAPLVAQPRRAVPHTRHHVWLAVVSLTVGSAGALAKSRPGDWKSLKASSSSKVRRQRGSAAKTKR